MANNDSISCIYKIQDPYNKNRYYKPYYDEETDELKIPMLKTYVTDIRPFYMTVSGEEIRKCFNRKENMIHNAERREEMNNIAIVAHPSNNGNKFNCSECPENRGETGGASRVYPCGQQNCWVSCHCSVSEEEA